MNRICVKCSDLFMISAFANSEDQSKDTAGYRSFTDMSREWQVQLIWASVGCYILGGTQLMAGPSTSLMFIKIFGCKFIALSN